MCITPPLTSYVPIGIVPIRKPQDVSLIESAVQLQVEKSLWKRLSPTGSGQDAAFAAAPGKNKNAAATRKIEAREERDIMKKLLASTR